MIVRFSGGLGNQMFQYAFFRELQYRFPNLIIECDLGDYERVEHHNGFELERIFHIKLPLCSKERTEKNKINITLPFRLLRKMGFKNVGYPKRILDEMQGYDKTIWTRIRADDFLWGYWQSENYFASVKDDILKTFCFPEFEDDKNRKLRYLIENTNSVALHVRRGDYLAETSYVSLCDSNYYTNAIKLVKNIINNPVWFIFSDDINWCKKHLNTCGEKYFVEGNTGKDSYKDMQLMSSCKNIIIANSTFSWWGAYLNRSKMVIAPSKFYTNNPSFNKSILCPGWRQVEL